MYGGWPYLNKSFVGHLTRWLGGHGHDETWKQEHRAHKSTGVSQSKEKTKIEKEHKGKR